MVRCTLAKTESATNQPVNSLVRERPKLNYLDLDARRATFLAILRMRTTNAGR
jgi:hypothetical protein